MHQVFRSRGTKMDAGAHREPQPAFEKFIKREVLRKLDRPLVWGNGRRGPAVHLRFRHPGFRAVSRLAQRALLDPDGPWSRLTMAIVRATEPHLFIQDLNQSPFNLGTKIALQDFTGEQVLAGDSDEEARMRYRLYAEYPKRQML